LQIALAKKVKCILLNLWLCRFNRHCCYGRRVIGNGVRQKLLNHVYSLKGLLKTLWMVNLQYLALQLNR